MARFVKSDKETSATEFLTLDAIAAKPETVASHFSRHTGETIVFRPLMPDDQERLTTFLEDLSPRTRRFSTYSGYDQAAAREFCDAINRYDKLRLVALAGLRVVALFEFSLYISDFDKDRYRNYGIELNGETDVRFGPCLADDYQDRGLGSDLLPYTIAGARCLGKRRMILWGGVLADNHRALHFYKKNGFRMVGTFQNDQSITCHDAILAL